MRTSDAVMKRVCVLGLGYIGLPTACLIATQGYQVIGVDTNDKVVARVNRGEVPFKEPELEELLQKSLQSGKLTAKTEPDVADVFLIAVPTSLDAKTKTADLGYVRQAANSFAHYLRRGNLVIVESTVSPGTSERVVLPILESSGLKGGKDFYLAHCPERAIPGNTIYEMTNNDRIIGAMDGKSAEMAKKLYGSFVKGQIYGTDLRTAEIIKLMENTHRDINIALANEFAKIAEESAVDIWEAIDLANRHPRVNILKPGPGVGGHCLAIDPWFLTEHSAKSRIIGVARDINDSMPYHVLDLVKQLIEGTKDANITVLGVAYKGNVSDTRETPALRFIELAKKQGYKVKLHDPWVERFDYELCSLDEAVRGSNCLVLITDHRQFRQLDPQRIASLMKDRNLVDTRNFLGHQKWQEAGFKLRVLGNGRDL
ncbi:nucleotide sugar dehydrogenase [Chloroflexota bacterium]